MKTKLLLAFSTALYKSLKYLPHTNLWIIGHYSKGTCMCFTSWFRSEKIGGSIAVTICTQVYVLQLSSEPKWSSRTGFVNVHV